MADFDTTDVERMVLKAIVSQKTISRIYLHTLNLDWFTSEPRKFILRQAKSRFDDTKALLSDKVFQFDVETKIEDSKQHLYLTEWTLTQQATANDDLDGLLAILEEEALRRSTFDFIERVAGMLETGNPKEAANYAKRKSLDLISRHDMLPVVQLGDYKERRDRLQDMYDHPDKYSGLKTGFEIFDNATGGLYPGEYTLIAAMTGIGKSTMLKAIEDGMLRSNNRPLNVLHVTNEENLLQVQQKFDALTTGIPYLDFKRAFIMETGREDDLKRWEDRMKLFSQSNQGKIFIKEIPAFSNITEIERVFYELDSQGVKIDAIFLDYLSNLMPIKNAYDPNDERAKASADVKELARMFHVPVVSAAQGATELEKKQEKGKSAGRLDIYGSKAQIHPVNTFIIVTLEGYDNTMPGADYEKDRFWKVSIKKNRDGAAFTFYCRHWIQAGLVESVSEAEVNLRISAQASGAAAFPLVIPSLEDEDEGEKIEEIEDEKTEEIEDEKETEDEEIKEESNLQKSQQDVVSEMDDLANEIKNDMELKTDKNSSSLIQRMKKCRGKV